MSALSNGVATTSSSSNKMPATNNGSGAALPNPAAATFLTKSPNANTSASPSSTTRKAHQKKDDPAATLPDASSPAEVRSVLARLHTRESALTSRLTALFAAQQDISRSLARLDNLRAGLGAQVIATRGISNNMLAGASETAAHLSSRVRTLDLEKQRVEDTLRVVEQVVELKACVAGVVGSMGAPQDWEAAAGYIARAAKVPDEIVRGGFAAAVVPTVEVPDPPWVTLETSRESLCGLFLREFEKAAAESDWARVTRFFKLFPLIGRGDVGLEVYGHYVCQGVAETARAVLKEGASTVGGQGRKDGFFYANALTRLFKHIADIVDGHGGLVERYYGAGKMIKVIERLQVEADVQGGIILDSWTDERAVDRRLTDVRSYPFSFLVQSFIPRDNRGFGGTPRVSSPAQGGGTNDPRSSEDEGVNMKEVDALLSEIAAILGQWFFYSRFLAGKCKDPESPDDAPLSLPDVVTNSNLNRKVSAKLAEPYEALTTFFFRRSVEKAFQLDESPTGLSLNMSRAIDSNSPFISSAVDDVMYIVNTVILKTISTSQRGLIDSVIANISRVLGSDFIGMIQRKMRDESYPKPLVSGGFPPEDKIIAFIVLINNLDMSNEYLARIVLGVLGPPDRSNGNPGTHQSSLQDSFPFKNDAKDVMTRLNSLNTSFSYKATELLNDGIDVLFKQVAKPRLRPVLTETFRDADYTLSEEELAEIAAENDEDEDDLLEQVPRRFEHGWDALMKPIARLMTPKTFSGLLDRTARHLAKMLEKRVESYSGGRISPYGAVRMERDFNGIIGAVTKGNYAVRELFGKTTQILMVANMEDDEWEELVAAEEAGDGDGMLWVLSEEERRKARTMVKR
ncbi:COG4 transport protein-domain-containing protein [Podospora didyma]|uniref:Conserved oligomeric Golgi complex subunit 4 n=1 Tax=Podospora didyma TaxID=330526 RepID=A0AAE0U814_9PEZI|nr:COG4 transport protein-domain-containing protein [Podospora didyma]